MANGILADSINGVAHIEAFDLMWAQRLSQIEADAVLVYVIDTVDASALSWLARQFDVEGYRGYILATNDEERRKVIKQAIELKRYMGTVWAVREAMRAVGYANAILDEGVDSPTVNQAIRAADMAADAIAELTTRVTADGGTVEAADCLESLIEKIALETDNNWAKFRVTVDLGNNAGLDGNTPTALAKLINEYKNVRSHLLDISFIVSVTDTIPPLTDIFNLDFYQPDIVDDLGHRARFRNGTYNYNGAIDHNDGNDYLRITIQ